MTTTRLDPHHIIRTLTNAGASPERVTEELRAAGWRLECAHVAALMRCYGYVARK